MPYKDPKDPRNLEAQKRYREKHGDAHRARVKARNAINRIKWAEFKKTLKCALCTENHPTTLDFHHIIRSPDNKKVHKLVRDRCYKQAIEEIRTKCVVLCANCHRKGHYYEHHGIPLNEPNYSQYEEWFHTKSIKKLEKDPKGLDT